jgi:hypothetical protein
MTTSSDEDLALEHYAQLCRSLNVPPDLWGDPQLIRDLLALQRVQHRLLESQIATLEYEHSQLVDYRDQLRELLLGLQSYVEPFTDYDVQRAIGEVASQHPPEEAQERALLLIEQLKRGITASQQRRQVESKLEQVRQLEADLDGLSLDPPEADRQIAQLEDQLASLFRQRELLIRSHLHRP